MIIVLRIMHGKVDRRLNVTNKFKYQRRLSSRLPIVMFRGTPCTWFRVHRSIVAGFVANSCPVWYLERSLYLIEVRQVEILPRL